jgi:hypothetical protein
LEHYFSQVRLNVFLSQVSRTLSLYSDTCKAEDESEADTSTSIPPKVDDDIGKHTDGSKTDDEVVQK